MLHFVYIVRCADDTLYTGYARDPKKREDAHNQGRGARYTCGRRPVSLVYSEAFASKSAALRREYELKQWNRQKKLALAAAHEAQRLAQNSRSSQRKSPKES